MNPAQNSDEILTPSVPQSAPLPQPDTPTAKKVFIILGTILIVAALLMAGFVALKAYTDSQKTAAAPTNEQRAQLAKLDTQAKLVGSKAEAYYNLTSRYPKDIAEFAKFKQTKLDPNISVTTDFITSTKIAYISCTDSAAQIAYYGATKSDIHIKALGTASSTELCVQVR